MSVLLKNWPSVQISEVVDINPRPEIDELHDETLASFIPMRCVEEESGRFEPLENRKIRDVRKGYTPFRDGDVLFAKVTPCMENGKAAVMNGLTNGIGFGSTEFFALRPRNGMLPKFLFFFITQESFRRAAAANMTGAVGLRRVPKNYLAEQPIPLPPLPKQRLIVAEIEKRFTRLDAGVSALRRVQANLKRYRAAVLKAACEGRLVPTEAELQKSAAKTQLSEPNYETGAQLLARILSERRKNWQGRGQYKEPASSDSTSLPQLPDGWACASLGEVCYRITDGTHLKPTYVERGMPFLSVKNVRPGRIYDTDIKYISAEQHAGYVKRCRPEKGDILYTKVGATYGYAAINTLDYEFSIYVSLALLKYPQQFIEPKYIEWCMNSPVIYTQAQKRIKGIGRPDLHLEEIRDFYFPLPPLAEQTRIVAEVERRLSVIEELEMVVHTNLQRATRLRQSILKKAFSPNLSISP